MDSNSDKLTRATSNTSLTSTDDEFVYLNEPKTREVGTMTVEIDSISKIEESKVDKDEKSVDNVVNVGTNTTSAGVSIFSINLIGPFRQRKPDFLFTRDVPPV
uniref:Uncharacterized protein n=1 Tax=Meloidogyne enterolobii TaxID=390850 RepID=A0A6V7V6C5_MELEN|nr:unnamed protein product [Meloidogyne enterolobii]